MDFQAIIKISQMVTAEGANDRVMYSEAIASVTVTGPRQFVKEIIEATAMAMDEGIDLS